MTDELSQAVATGTLDQATAEKIDHLAPGAFCTHKSWGFGRVAEWNLTGGQILIDFKTRKGHPMQLAYAAETLTPIPESHILARRENDPQGVKADADADAATFLRATLADLGGKATSDQISSLLSPSVFTPAAFKRWWDAARKKIKTDGHFKLPTKKTDPYVLLEEKVDAAQGLLNTFREARHTRDQLLALDQITKALTELKSHESEMPTLVAEIGEIAARHRRLQTPAAIEMLVARDEIAVAFAIELTPDAPSVSEVLSSESSRLSEIFSAIPASRQRDALESFEKAFGELWSEKALGLLRDAGGRLVADISRLFEKKGKKENLQSTLERWISERSISSEMLIWLCKDRDKRFPELFNAELLAAVFSALEADQLAEKRTSRLRDLLVDDRELIGDLLINASRDVVRDSMRKLMLTPVFDDLSKRSLMARIVKLYPDTQDMITGKQQDERADSLIVSWPSIEKRKAELDQLVTKEIPQNLRDINIAKEQGDLRENAGFKAAKEHQRVLQGRRVEMERDLAHARGTNFENPSTSQVSIGTVVTVRYEGGDTETYSILGAWDSSPQHGIISYKAGVGQSLLEAALGSSVELPAEHGTRKATVEAITPFTDLELLQTTVHALKADLQSA
jgi:transcription elongation GreA/GreB family factor